MLEALGMAGWIVVAGLLLYCVIHLFWPTQSVRLVNVDQQREQRRRDLRVWQAASPHAPRAAGLKRQKVR